MTKNTTCRCSECSKKFIPDPRVGERQVTCGDAQCQIQRHKKKCREWHQQNPLAGACHYIDVIVLYRKKYPDYQRSWYWLRRLREIREEIERLYQDLKQLLKARGDDGPSLTEPVFQVPKNIGKKIQSAREHAQQMFARLTSWMPVLEALET
jgi:hypothetical protein